jgi:hypothetical protein
MGRLNQSRRQKIGYSYCPQVINDVAIQPKMRNMSLVQEQAFDQNMHGEGIKEIIRGILDNKKQILEMGSKAVDIAMSEAGKIVFDTLPTDKQEQIKRLQDRTKPIQNVIQRRQDIADMVKTGTKMYNDIKGPAGGSRGSIQPSVGSGLSPAGGMYHGGAIDIRGNQEGDTLPGDALKKKLLQKMVRERRMRSLGDRTKTTPLQAGFNGGSLVIPTNNNKMGSQSRSKTLPSSKTYKLNPKPLIGAGKGQEGGFIFSAIAAAIAAISAAASAAAATTVVGTVTVGSLVGTALTAGAATAGGIVVNKIAGNGVGAEIKKKLVNIAKKTKISFSDLPKEDQQKLKSEFDKLKKNKSKAGVIEFAKSIAPIALKATKKTLKPEFTKVFKETGLSGSGLKLAGQGLSLVGAGEKKFKNEFVKNMVNVLAPTGSR